MRASQVSPLLLVLCLLAAPAAGQGLRLDRGERALFGGGIGETEHVLTASGTLGGGFLTNASTDGPADDAPRVGAGFGFLSGGLNYRLNRRRVGLSAALHSSGNYYPRFASSLSTSHSASAGGSVQLARRTRLGAQYDITYQPYSFLALMPILFDGGAGFPDIVALHIGVANERFITQRTGVDLSHEITRRVLATGSYSYSFADLPASRSNDFSTHGASGTLSIGIARGLGVRVGYFYSQSAYPLRGAIRGNAIDAGLHYDRPLSLSRRTRVAFSSGTTAVSDFDRTRYALVGSASLTHELARTWTTSVVYNRSVGFIALFEEPYFYDTVSARLNGLVARRLPVHAGVGFNSGNVGFDGARLRSYYADAGTSVALNRHASVGISYTYSQYTFVNQRAGLAPGLPEQLGRHGVRGYLSLWAPLLHRARRPDAAR